MGFPNKVLYSASRSSMLKDCGRQYFYKVYVMWGGWWGGRNRPPVTPRAEKAYVAKFASTRFMWAGTIVHNQAEWALKTAMEGRIWEREDLRNAMLGNAAGAIDKGLKQARDQRSGNPKQRVQLVEENFGVEWDEEWFRERVRSRIIALTSVDDAWDGVPINLFLRAMSDPGSIISVEDMLRFKHRDMDVFLSLDLQMRSARDRTGECVVVDWKTGAQKPADDEQIGVYGLWASTRRWNSVRMVLVYLGDGTTEVRLLEGSPETEDRARKNIDSFLKDLSSRLVDGDMSRNVPIEEAFRPTLDATRCALCPMQAMCERDGTKPRS